MIEELYTAYQASSGVSTDTRTLTGDEIFFALQGENFDGNQFVRQALEAGCKYVVTDDQSMQKEPGVFYVENSLNTLQQLAQYHRNKWAGRLMAITGSNGKTTTKELVSSVLSKKYSCIATKGNLNNHIGVPLTILKIRHEDVAIIEMGANHPGEIATLCDIASPDVGIITNIGKAHLEGFGSFEGVAKAKGELYNYLAEHKGTAIVNESDPKLVEMAAKRKLNRFSYGMTSTSDITGEIISSLNNIEGIFSSKGKQYTFKSELFGEYNFMNILAAISAGVFFDVSELMISEAIEDYRPENNRSQVLEGKSNTLILDAYNANPSSMTLALHEFFKRDAPKKMVILGEMAELGKASAIEHKYILDLLVRSQIKEVILVGEHFYSLSDEAAYPFHFFQNLEECMIFIKNSIPRGYLILLKGSRINSLEYATNVLLDC